MAKTATKTKTAEKKAPIISTSNFVVIKTGGKQYRVSEGAYIKIEKIIDAKVGDKITFDEVLLSENGKDTVVGTPTIAGAKVQAEVLEIAKGDKVIIYRYKQKNRSGTPRNGHRQTFMKVKITSIS